MKNGDYRGKLRSVDSQKEFDISPFLLNQTAAHVQEALTFAQNASKIGRNFCETFLTVAQEGLSTNDTAIQTDSLALASKVAAATDNDDIRAEVLSLLRSQFNNRNGSVAEVARQTYSALQSDAVDTQQQAASNFPTLCQHS